MFEKLRNYIASRDAKTPVKSPRADMFGEEFWQTILSGEETWSGIGVTEETALNLSGVFACVRILSETIGALPLHVYQNRPDGGKDRALNHPLSRIFGGVANDELTAQELKENILLSGLLRGTFYAEKSYGGNGQLDAIYPLYAKYMAVTRDKSKRLVFDYREPGRPRVFTASQIWRVAAFGGNGVTGFSTIKQAKQSLGTALAMEQHAGRTFANGARISGVFSMPGALKDEAFARLKKQLEKYTGAKNAGKTLFLEQDMKWQQVGMNHEDSQLLESRRFELAEICRWFRVPLHLVNELEKATFSNIENLSIDFVRFSILPWCTRIESSIQRDLITPQNRGRYFARFAMDALLRGDTESRYRGHGMAIRDGWLSRNEVRVLEDRNPAPGLDEFVLPLNMGTDTDEDRKKADPKTEPKAPAPEDVIKEIAAREVSAIRVEKNRLEPEAFALWASDYYVRLNDSLGRMDGISAEDAQTYTSDRLLQLNQARNIDDLLDRWEP